MTPYQFEHEQNIILSKAIKILIHSFHLPRACCV